ncbi:MAG: histidine--tRNA ligase [Verrucomicrobiae bacterium]|nr:histidine--tRNA ligase [Verrucomicrobiae bacterium]
MSIKEVQSLPGFREFYPESCAVRNYIFDMWRNVAHRYGFAEWEGPVLEPTDLYRRKSGDEIAGQLFCFEDKGGRDVSLRPELTPSLARMAVAKQREYKKPLRWFEIGACFRYEKPQKGRLREFYQFNCDMLGESAPAIDAELIALAIDVMTGFGFTKEHFAVRLSDRNIWKRFMQEAGVPEENETTLLQIIDKLERTRPDVLDTQLQAIGTSLAAVQEFTASKAETEAVTTVRQQLEARGFGDFVSVDLSIVRGLAYYTGVVFEIFDCQGDMRAVAGGGRYDNLAKLIGGSDMPAAGFAMGDVVIGNFIEETPVAKAKLDAYVKAASELDAYVIVASEERRPDALGIVQKLRSAGLRVDFALTAAKVGKQFQSAEQRNARLAVIVGDEFPEVSIKNLTTREEVKTTSDGVVEAIQHALA